MAVSWEKGNNDPISHLEDLIHEVVIDKCEYIMGVNETRLNGKINSILVRINLLEGEGSLNDKNT